MVPGRILVLLFAADALFPHRAAGQDALHLSDSITRHSTAQLRADTVRLSPEFQTVTAAGDVFFDISPLKIRGDWAMLSLNAETIVVRHAELRFALLAKTALTADRALFDIKTGRLFLRNFNWRRSSLARFDIRGRGGLCQNGTCLFRDVSASLCDHGDTGYELNADRIVLYPNGALDVRGIHLSVHKKSTVSLPFLHLRPPGKPGFTAPKLAFDPEGGLIVGPSGILPLEDDAYVEGGVALRSRQGFESRTHLSTRQTDLKIDQLFIAPDNLMRYRLKTAQPRNGLFFGTDIDYLQSDRRIIDNGTFHYLERAMTHTVSRVRLAGQNDLAVVESSVEAVQSFDEEEPFAHPSLLSPEIRLAAAVPPVPMGGGFFGMVNADLIRRGPWNEAPETTAENEVPVHTRLVLETGIAHIRRIGPLAVDLDLAARTQKWLVDDPDRGDPGLLILGGALRIAAPLFRDFKDTRHVISPFVAYRITPTAWGHTPQFTVDHSDLLRVGHGVETGFTTSLRKQQIETLRLDVYERIALNGLKGTMGPSYLAFRGRLGPPDFHLALDGAWDQRNRTVSVSGVSIHRNLDRASIDVGARRMDRGEGPHRDQPFSTSFVPWLAASIPENAAPAVEVFQNGELPINRRLRLFAGARGEVYPTQVLHALWYGLRLQSDCDCVALTITASHRVKNPVPDVYAAISLLGW